MNTPFPSDKVVNKNDGFVYKEEPKELKEMKVKSISQTMNIIAITHQQNNCLNN